MTDPFRVGLTSSFQAADGQLAFGDIGLGLLDREPGLEYEFNCPLSAATRGLIGDAQLRQMKPTAYLINTARGPIVDTAALTSALREGRLAGAGLDVTEPEPLPTDHPLLALDNVIVTSHRLAWTDDMVLRTGQATMLGMCKLARGEPPDHVVNTDVLARPGFLARVRARRTDAVSPLHS